MIETSVQIQFDVSTAPSPLRSLPALAPGIVSRIRSKMVLDHFKWDPQVGDVSTLAPFALEIDSATWHQLASWAEEMSREALAAERELRGHAPWIHSLLNLPATVVSLLKAGGKSSPAAARTVRYDFHWTAEGWRISEANTDVPGGFTEATELSRLMAEYYPQHEPAGRPGDLWAEAIVHRAREFARDEADAPDWRHPTIALLAAPGFMEDQQIMAYLGAKLSAHAATTCPADPGHIRWRDGVARLQSASHEGLVHAIVRFYQAEWLARLPRRTGWGYYFVNSRVPIANPATTLLTESKRFPLVWKYLRQPLPVWQSLLPKTQEVTACLLDDDGWLLKTAICNTGDTVSRRDLLNPSQWQRVVRDVLRHPNHWLAQKKFNSIPIATPLGPMHCCIGVYTIDGAAAGIYGRLSPKPLIDYSAMDVAVLIRPQEKTA